MLHSTFLSGGVNFVPEFILEPGGKAFGVFERGCKSQGQVTIVTFRNGKGGCLLSDATTSRLFVLVGPWGKFHTQAGVFCLKVTFPICVKRDDITKK